MHPSRHFFFGVSHFKSSNSSSFPGAAFKYSWISPKNPHLSVPQSPPQKKNTDNFISKEEKTHIPTKTDPRFQISSQQPFSFCSPKGTCIAPARRLPFRTPTRHLKSRFGPTSPFFFFGFPKEHLGEVILEGWVGQIEHFSDFFMWLFCFSFLASSLWREKRFSFAKYSCWHLHISISEWFTRMLKSCLGKMS